MNILTMARGATLIAFLAAGLPAHAVQITFGGCPAGASGLTTCVAGTTVQTFDNGLLPSNYTDSGGSGGHIVSGSTGTYAAPTGDSTPYLSVSSTTPTGSVTAALGQEYNYFGLYWGSIDSYNTITFYDHNTVVASFTGSDVIADTALFGDRLAAGSNEYVNFDFGSTSFDTVQFSSSNYAFESDNQAYGRAASVPEPATLGLLGLSMAGLLARRRR